MRRAIIWLMKKVKQVYLSEEGHQHIEEIFAEAGLLKEGGKPL